MLHPGFFTDGTVCSLPALARILFQALWCEADREGRMRDRPVDLKIRWLPVDDCDVNALLTMLAVAKLIVRYEAGGERFIALPNFLRYQHPHANEKASAFPPPPANASEPLQDNVERTSEVLPKSVESPPDIAPKDSGANRAVIKSESVSKSVPKEKHLSPLEPRTARTIVAPTKAEEFWDGDDFWSWAESVRQDGGFIADPKPRDLGSWFSACLTTDGVTIHALKEAFYAFGQNKHWEAKGFPFQAFKSQWTRFTRKDPAYASAS